METRKITVVVSNTQEKFVLNSSSSTLGELKSELNNLGVNYRNLTFFEGVSKTKLEVDEAILPTNIPYKGTITNDLVFILTSTKKIESGAYTYAELKEKVKEFNLEDEVKQAYGKNYTNCSTNQLSAIVESFLSKNKKNNQAKQKEEPVKDTIEKPSNKCTCSKDNSTLEERLTNIEKRISLLEEGTSLKSSSNTKESSPYSEEEIEDMYNFVK